jgi:hypothetical protein
MGCQLRKGPKWGASLEKTPRTPLPDLETPHYRKVEEWLPAVLDSNVIAVAAWMDCVSVWLDSENRIRNLKTKTGVVCKLLP